MVLENASLIDIHCLFLIQTVSSEYAIVMHWLFPTWVHHARLDYSTVNTAVTYIVKGRQKMILENASLIDIRGLSIKCVDFPHNSGSFQYFITKFL